MTPQDTVLDFMCAALSAHEAICMVVAASSPDALATMYVALDDLDRAFARLDQPIDEDAIDLVIDLSVRAHLAVAATSQLPNRTS